MRRSERSALEIPQRRLGMSAMSDGSCGSMKHENAFTSEKGGVAFLIRFLRWQGVVGPPGFIFESVTRPSRGLVLCSLPGFGLGHVPSSSRAHIYVPNALLCFLCYSTVTQ